MPFIKESSIQRIQENSDIVSVVESYGIKLKRSGSSFLAVCPFHNEKTPSFNVNPQLQIFKCFGCGVGGGVIKFVQLMERCEFPEAVEKLASISGVELEYEQAAERPGSAGKQATGSRDKKQAVRWACKQAFEYFRASYKDEVEGRRAREYLFARGFNRETVDGWGLGWAPDKWNGLLERYQRRVVALSGEHKREKSLAIGLEAGIFRKKEENQNYYDAFRNRVMFPIFDMQNRPIGFGGRVLEEKPASGGKYINTTETPVFAKRTLLFGLNFAAKEIGLTRTAIVVEGYTDTIMCHQFGVRNVVATLGTSLTVEHVKLLRRYIHNDGKVIALFDNDGAGKKATRRAIDIFMEEDVSLWVLSSLEVKDAGEFLPQFGVERFREFLSTARESFAYIVDEELGRDFSSDISGKTAAIERVMELVNRCPNLLHRGIMRKKVAEIAGVSEETLPQPLTKKGFGVQSRDSALQGKMDFAREYSGDRTGRSPSVPVILEAKKQGRLKAEDRLLKYMFLQREWCDRIVDQYPPDEWFGETEHLCAALLRDAWFETANRKLQVEKLLEKTVNEDIKGKLLDFIGCAFSDGAGMSGVGSVGEDESLSDTELEDILSRIRTDELKERRDELTAEHAKAELDGNHDLADRLLVEKMMLEKQIRSLSGI